MLSIRYHGLGSYKSELGIRYSEIRILCDDRGLGLVMRTRGLKFFLVSYVRYQVSGIRVFIGGYRIMIRFKALRVKVYVMALV